MSLIKTVELPSFALVWTTLHTLADFFVGRQKVFACQLVCGEFRQVCDKIGACWAISDSARSQNVLSGLVGWCAVHQDNLSGLARTSSNEELS